MIPEILNINIKIINLKEIHTNFEYQNITDKMWGFILERMKSYLSKLPSQFDN